MSVEGDDLATILSRALEGEDFDPYRDRDAPDRERLRAAILGIAEEAVAQSGGDALERFRSSVRAHLGEPGHRERYYNAISAFRTDRDPHFDTQMGEAEQRFQNAGAVHLELGTWTAWPTERQTALADAEGLAEVIRLDFEATYDLDVVADARRLPFRDNSIDRISADSVIEHIAQSELVLAECHRVLKPGGLVKMVTPFAFNLHGYPDDYLRYTPSWYVERFHEFGFETALADIDAQRGLYYTLHNSLKSAIVDPDHPDAAGLRTLHLIILDLLGTLVPLDDGFHNGARHWFTSVRAFAMKAGGYSPAARHRDWSTPFVDRCVDLLSVPGTDVALRRVGDALVSDTGVTVPIVDGIPQFTACTTRGRNGGLARHAARVARRARAALGA
jgi:SAM-dependent methyltransferase